MTKDSHIIYTILDFEINSEQRSIKRKSVPLKLSKKSFDMLLVLLQRHGELVTKDELMNLIWPNQIITDDALYKQITRLRKFLDLPNTDNSIIETIRGVGIRLIPPVQIMTVQNVEKPDSRTKKSFVKILLTGVITILAIGILIYYLSLNQARVINQNSENPANKHYKPVNIALVPAEKTQDWLNIGGLNYLSELLQQHDEIQAINPQTQWFNHDNSNILALELVQSQGIDYALVVKNIKQDGQFIAHITLRNEHNILANDIIEAATLLLLFEKMDTWTTQQLHVSSELSRKNDGNGNQPSNYALESYLRGLSAAQNRNFVQAAQFLQTAVNQNQSYYSAWLLLAEVEAELGHYQKALAMTNTIEGLNNFDSSLLNQLYNIKARILIYQNQLSAASILLDKSQQLSEKQHDMKVMIASLSNRALIQSRNGEISQKTLEIMHKQLELIKIHNPLPSQIAQLNHNLAVANRHLFDYKAARSYIDKAIMQYKKTNDNTGLLSSYQVLSLLHYDLAQTGDALLVLEKAESLLNTVDAPIIIGQYYISKARNLIQQGYRQQAKQVIDKLNKLSVTYANNQPKVIALTIKAELQILYHEIKSAKTTLQQLVAIVSTNPEDYPADAPYIAAVDMYFSARFESSQFARKKMETYLTTYPILKSYIPIELRRIEALILAQEGYATKSSEILHKLMRNYLDEKQILEALYVGYEILEVQWQHNMQDYLKTLNQIQELSTFDYPILKFRAQYYAYENDYINAAILMQELKPKAREFWTVDDQLLLEKYQEQSQLPKKHKLTDVF